MLKKILTTLLLSATLQASEITVAVAANVSYAMDALKAAFAATHPDVNVRVTLGSSGKLTAQIKNGAPYGLFMAANMKYPDALYKAGLAENEPVVYAQGALAVLSARSRDLGKGIALAADTSVRRIAIANPKTAPYGAAAVQALQKGGVYEKVRRKLVYAETISQTVTYALSAADLGFVAKSSLYSPKMTRFKENVHWVSVDPALYAPIKQGIILLKRGENRGEYRAFYDFIRSPEAAAIFKAYGYLVP